MKAWEDCHAAGMTAADAAAAMGKSDVAAHKWAKGKGLKWSKLTRAQMAGRILAGRLKARKERGAQRTQNGLGDWRNPALILEPEQERQGGAFWMVNNKTGERVSKSSATMVYRHAQLQGWTDWDWGQSA